MVWIDSWDTFYAEAEKLYTDHPDHVRTVPSTQHVALGSAELVLMVLRRHAT